MVGRTTASSPRRGGRRQRAATNPVCPPSSDDPASPCHITSIVWHIGSSFRVTLIRFSYRVRLTQVGCDLGSRARMPAGTSRTPGKPGLATLANAAWARENRCGLGLSSGTVRAAYTGSVTAFSSRPRQFGRRESCGVSVFGGARAKAARLGPGVGGRPSRLRHRVRRLRLAEGAARRLSAQHPCGTSCRDRERADCSGGGRRPARPSSSAENRGRPGNRSGAGCRCAGQSGGIPRKAVVRW